MSIIDIVMGDGRLLLLVGLIATFMLAAIGGAIMAFIDFGWP
jgi:hypothetical protein